MFLRKTICSVIAILIMLTQSNTTLNAAEADTPLQAVALAQQGIDTCNYDLFKQAVDIDAVLHSGMMASVTAMKKQLDRGGLPHANPVLILLLSGLDTNDPLKMQAVEQLLSAEVTSFIVSGINEGYFEGTRSCARKGARSATSSALLDGLSKGKKELVGHNVLHATEKQAKVSATFVDHGAGKFPLELTLVKTGNQWRITKINNVEELLQPFTRE